MNKNVSTFIYNKSFKLESGKHLDNIELKYCTYGSINKNKSNIVWVFHALTGSHEIENWWLGAIGKNKLLNTNKYFIICVNSLASCYGSTSPLFKNKKGKKYYYDFPIITNKDIINSFELLRKHLEIKNIFIGIGASLGGQHLLEWACLNGSLFKKIIPIATNSVMSSWGVAFSKSQRMAIENDYTWGKKIDNAGLNGLKCARSIAMLSYRSYDIYNKKLKANKKSIDCFPASSYQKYQGEKLKNRFNALCYWYLTKTMDSHNISRGRETLEKSLNKINSSCLIIGISSDILFPLSEQKFIYNHIKNSRLYVLESNYGHDAFLVEIDKITDVINDFLSNGK